jgi:citrate/tricarballylate utilization protein
VQQLEALIRAAEAEVDRQMQICNACRYCEGFCAVFPAMTRRLAFGGADAHYLANLCHNCGACLHACQYAPPHEFAVNVPRAMALLRVKTYEEFAWPRGLGGLYRRNGLFVALALAAWLSFFLVLLVLRRSAEDWRPLPLDSDFYAIFPHGTLVAMFGVVFLWAALALCVGVARFWREARPGGGIGRGAVHDATADALSLRYLDGGHGEGCNDEDDRFTLRRRLFHHFTFYGFLLCFAATCVATVYHYALDWAAPYPVDSLPVILGTLGGIGLLIGPSGLLWLNLRRNPMHTDPAQRPMDIGFIVLLFATSITGLALLAWRDTPALGVWLAIHLGCVMALFLTLPYGKFAHAAYRVAALLKYQVERRRKNPVAVGGD